MRRVVNYICYLIVVYTPLGWYPNRIVLPRAGEYAFEEDVDNIQYNNIICDTGDTMNWMTVGLKKKIEPHEIDKNEPYYDWDKLPRCIQWCAIDEDGDGYGYDEEPIGRGEYPWFNRYGEYTTPLEKHQYSLNGCPWQESKRQRPALKMVRSASSLVENLNG